MANEEKCSGRPGLRELIEEERRELRRYVRSRKTNKEEGKNGDEKDKGSGKNA